MGENNTYRIVNVWVASTGNGHGADLQEIERLADEIEAIANPAANQLARELRAGISEAREKNSGSKNKEKVA